MCDFGYSWSNAAWACVESGSAACEELCSRAEISPSVCEACTERLYTRAKPNPHPNP